MIFLMAGTRTDQRTWVVLGNTKQGKGEVSITKVLFFSYSAKEYFIQLTWSGPFRACPKFEGSTGVVVEETS